MPEHNFEEEARRIMDPFRVDPSPAVWERLEASLTARKRRRRIFYLFILAGLLLGGGFYQWSQSRGRLPLSGQASHQALPDGSLKPDAEDEAGKASLEPAPGKTAPAGGLEEAGGSEPSTNKAVVRHAGQPGKKPPVRNPASKVPGIRFESPAPGKVPQVEKGIRGEETFTGEETHENTAWNPGLATVESPTVRHILPNIPRTVPADGAGVIALPDSILSNSGKLAEKHNRKNRSIQYGLHASLGRSAFTDGLGPTSKAMADQTVSQPGSMPLPNLPAYDYRQDPSLGFSAGAWMELPMSTRWDLRVGFSYLQYATRTPVGIRVDSNRNFTGSLGTQDAQAYYRAAENGDYTNRFHLIEVPVQVAWKLNPRGSLPVSWTMGLSPGWMVSSNALVYDGSQSLYHSDENLQRFQLGIQTGFRFGFMQRSAHPLQIGPVLQYQLSRAFRDGVNGNGHLYFLGLEVSMPLFHTNKKQR